MSDEQACEVPLVEQLRSIPEDYRTVRAIQWDQDGRETGHQFIQVGFMMHRAAAQIERLSARPEAVRIREDEARECLAIAKTYSEPFLSPTAEEICNAIERRVMTHLDQTLPTPNKTL